MTRVGLACASLLAISACFAPDTTPFGNASLGLPPTSDATADTIADDPSTTGGPTTDVTADATSSTTADELTSDDTAVDSSSGGTADVCGDGMLSGTEACDDGDVDVGDGCSDTCEEELGFSCVGRPSTCTSSCGDGIAAADEDCDDDNDVNGDGCTACAVDRGFQCRGVMPSVCSSPCGDGMLDGGESCDDGDVMDGNGCAADCTVELYHRCVGAGAGSCAPIRIGYVPADGDDATFRGAIAAITGGTVDYSSASAATPTLVTLQASYDCVFTHANSGYADSLGFGNILAGYVDGGGSVVLGIATDFAPPTGLSTSMIMQDTYSPIGTAGGVTYGPLATYAGDGTTPIHTSVVTYTAEIFDAGVAVQGAGIQDGTYDNGTIAAAYRPDFKVVYLNGTGNATFTPTGDWPRLVANACAVGFLQ